MSTVTPKRWIAELLLLYVAAGWEIGFPVMKLAINSHSVLMVLGICTIYPDITPFGARKIGMMPFNTLAAGVVLDLLLGVAFIFLISRL
ncbi:MAG: hypothetical protein ACSLEN_06350 [Candidatus Malihini olakiniferum]